MNVLLVEDEPRVADFIAGAAEQITLRGADHADVVLVEGQGSINHPGYSGVTLGLLHGSCPDAMILCHQASREYIGDYRKASWLKIPPLAEYVEVYERIAGMVHPSKVIGIAMNTYDLDEDAARAVLRQPVRPPFEAIRRQPVASRPWHVAVRRDHPRAVDRQSAIGHDRDADEPV